MTPKIKICGIRREEEVKACNAYLPDYVGFMFWEGSKRYIDFNKAKDLGESLDSRIKRVGVFVNSPISDVANADTSGIIDIVQLHGQEDEEYIKTLKYVTDLPVIKAFSVKNGAAAEDINNSSADMVLVDSGRGGMGEAFDWSFLGGIKRDYFLAGGLDLNNAKEAANTNAYALDVSSGVETDGYKDADKIAKFITAVRGVKE